MKRDGSVCESGETQSILWSKKGWGEGKRSYFSRGVAGSPEAASACRLIIPSPAFSCCLDLYSQFSHSVSLELRSFVETTLDGVHYQLTILRMTLEIFSFLF